MHTPATGLPQALDDRMANRGPRGLAFESAEH